MMIGPSATTDDLKLLVQLVHSTVMLTLGKFPSNSHDTPIVSKDGELILHIKASVIQYVLIKNISIAM